ncbi:hypothetical protein C8Q78DRAFT_1061541 [Trametes maxima]|nr:hypothetical protein C8Q78DRAFT_1061541 [Trametes maxima]
MESVFEALREVEAAVSKCKGKEKKRLAEIAGHVSSHLVLLKLHSLSQQVAQKLSTFLRESLRILYKGFTLSALRLASALLQAIYHERVLPAIGSMQRDQQGLWELVLYSLLAGVLDFLDESDTKDVKSAIGEALYPSICELCFSLTAPKTNIDLRCTAYNILSDSAALHQGNQQRLREKAVLGGQRLGSCIWRTKDYLALEGLLNIFARALPSTNNSAPGRAKRTAYIHSVFKSCEPPDALGLGTVISQLLEDVPTSNWEDTAVRLVDILAKGNITFPQPFILQNIIACGKTYPSDRLYADDKIFLANVLLGDDQYESLEIAYSSISSINTEPLTCGDARVAISMNRLPRLGKEPVSGEEDHSADLSAGFIVRADEVDRFARALQSRNLNNDALGEAKPPPTLKLSLAKTPANLELDSAGRPVPELSQSERIENVSQFYKTDERSDILSSGEAEVLDHPVTAPDLQSDHLPTPLGDSVNVVEARPPTSTLSANLGDANATTGLVSKHLGSYAASGSLSRTGSHLMRAAAFGLSDEELSDISDYDSPLPRPKAISGSTISGSLIRGRISFQTIATKSGTGTSSSATRVTRGGVGKVVLDSDDESLPAAPYSLATRRAKMNLARNTPADKSQQNSAPLPLPPPAIAALAALDTPLPLPGDETLASSNTVEKVLRFSDIPAPNFNAPISSPAVVPKSALKSAFAKKHVSSHFDNMNPAPAGSAPNLVSSTATTPAASKKNEESALKASNILNDLAPLSSSPTPASKRSIKSNLRKKEPPASTDPKVLQPTLKKRKNAPESDVENPGLLATKYNGAENAFKRARAAPPAKEDVEPQLRIIDERSESQILRPRVTAATRATKKYRARKGRTSSPSASLEDPNRGRAPVDYDALPSPPRASAATTKSSSPVPKPKARVARQIPRDVVSRTIEGAQTHPKERDQIEKEAIPKARAARKTRAGTQRKAAKSSDIVSEAALTVIHSDIAIPTAQPGKRRPQRTSRKANVKASLVNAAKEIDDIAAPLLDLTEPNRVDDAFVLPSLSLGNIVSLQIEPGSSKAILTASLVDPGPDSNMPTHPESINLSTVSKRSNAPPWDVVFGSASRAQVDERRGASGSVKTTPAPSGEIAQPTNADDDRGLKMVNMIEESAVDLPSPGPQKTVQVGKARSTGAALFTPVSSHMKITEHKDTFVPGVTLASVKKEVETIDLTLDSPPKTVKRPSRADNQPNLAEVPSVLPQKLVVLEARNETLKTDRDNTSGHDDSIREYLGSDNRNLAPGESRPSRLPPSPSPLPDIKYSPFDRYFGRGPGQRLGTSSLPRNRELPHKVLPGRKKVEMAEEMTSRYYEQFCGDPAMYAIAEMTLRVNDVLVDNINNKFEGVRHHARLGCHGLLRDAIEDLHAIRAESVAHFNKLVDLEAEYATAARGLIHGSEDWTKTSHELGRELVKALEQHDRNMLSKKMPASLIVLKL